MNCIICKNKTKVYYDHMPDRLHTEVAGIYTVTKCRGCYLLAIEPQPTDEDLSKHYPENYHVYQRRPGPIPARKIKSIKNVARHFFGYSSGSRFYMRILLYPFFFKLTQLPFWKKDGKLLDIGCGVGDRMQVFKELGWQVEGLEMSPVAAGIAKEGGFDVTNGSLTEVEMPANKFDVVHLNNVFEHFKDPHKALRNIKRTLRNGGELILVVPSSGGLAARIFKKNWFGLEVPRHLYTYNKINLSILLSQHNFEEIKSYHHYTFGSMTSSIAYKLGKPIDTYAFMERPLWFMNLILDPVLNIFIGDWMTVRARIRKRND